ncbi:alkaline phosphatase family protein [Acuticoccus sp. M5D2P5]|uniref:alkaline phosphatase family protein n=1 Tax=Acuticoccus kalidii TaxID=2910977 RepID=UPI001F199055|nr:alkaline phosphatase family protein [Acuticoccus kalidii]
MTLGSTLLVTFDGLRSDRATAALMPNLAAFMAEASRFANARSVFPSETRVAVTSTFTGAPPLRHGLVANAFRHPAVPERTLQTGSVADLLHVASKGPLIDRPSLGDRLAAAGKSMVVVSSASTGATHMMNPNAAAHGHAVFSCHQDPDRPTALQAEARARLGPIPATGRPNAARIAYVARVVTDIVWPTHDPDVCVLWLNDPDLTSHAFGVTATETEAAQRHADDAFGEILAWWRAGKGPENLIVMSDHGQITGAAVADPLADLPAEWRDRSAAGVFNGIWFDDPSAATLERAVDRLIEMPWCGLVFSGRAGAPAVRGTLPLDLVGQGHERSPDIAFTLRSTGPDATGPEAQRRLFVEHIDVGGGIHGGLNEGELATVLAMAGPCFRDGFVSETPCWLPDIAPTILTLLGLPTEGTSGRPLTEAFLDGEPPRVLHTVHEAAHRGFEQRLARWTVAGKGIVDRGWTDGTGAWR